MHRVIELEFTESFLGQIVEKTEERPLDRKSKFEDCNVSNLLWACQAGGNVTPEEAEEEVDELLVNCCCIDD